MDLMMKYEDLYEKINSLCDENDLKFEFNKEVYPVRVTLTLMEKPQISLFEEKFEEKKRNIMFTFDEIPTIKSDYEIEKKLLDKIINLSKKLYACHLELFFKRNSKRSETQSETGKDAI